MSKGDNWSREETQKWLKEQAEKELKKLKTKRKEKKYKVVKVCDINGVPIKPITYKEIEITNEDTDDSNS